jgi:hypothetical protein
MGLNKSPLLKNSRGLSMTEALTALGLFIVLILIVVFSTDILSGVRTDTEQYDVSVVEGVALSAGEGAVDIVALANVPANSIISVENVTNNATLIEGTGNLCCNGGDYIFSAANDSVAFNSSHLTNLSLASVNITYRQAGTTWNTSTNSLTGLENYSGRFGNLGTILMVAVLLGVLFLIIKAVGVL